MSKTVSVIFECTLSVFIREDPIFHYVVQTALIFQFFYVGMLTF